MFTKLNLSGYSIQEQIYAGSRVTVHRGTLISNQMPVVIKLMRSEYPSFSEIIQFRNQYSIAKNLDIPGIVKPYSLETYNNGYALVMEDFGGISLLESAQNVETGFIASEDITFLSNFLTVAIQITTILNQLHCNRVIHKDIKPANILINPNTKQVKLIDFSISSLLPRETQQLKNPNVLEGTLAYISPEQTGRMNRGIDYRTDFYSLGITFYELLTGQLPFYSNDPMELLHCHIAKQATPVHYINKNIPIIISNIINKLMAKNAEDRYQSALGLQFDLENCLSQYKETGHITSFTLGNRDINDSFIIPEKLYGRESEVKTLLQAFERASKLSSEMILVAGFSGIGKTAIVNEIQKPIVKQRGYFIKGKYDQFQRNIPFSAFVQAFRDLIRQLLGESNSKIQQWKTSILNALGENGQVIIEVLPELEQLIGKQPPVPELSGSATQNRFNLLFQKFSQVFTSAEHPLVIFLDDLQWVDSASLNLMQLLMTNAKHLLLIGAYRDNEVNPTHPLILKLAEFEKAEVVINTITLSPLKLDDLNSLVSDTLACNTSTASNLTTLIYQKTKGNPFFSNQFLKYLYENQLITFNLQNNYWQCDIAKVKALAVTDDVVEFMALKLQKLPQATQEVLKLAACIGNQFDLSTLSIVYEKSQVDTAFDLWKSLQDGLILPISQVYKFYQENSDYKLKLENEQANEQLARYRFLHDRVQQAAYLLIPENQKQATHLKIGQQLLHNYSEIDREEKLFDIVEHLNLGKDLIVQSNERKALAQLNLESGLKARKSTAYTAAISYLRTGIELLAADCFISEYELALNLHVAMAEAAYLNGDFDEMEKIATLVLNNSRTILDKIKVYEIQIAAYTAKGQMLDAIAVGQDALRQLGIDLPSSASEAEINQALQDLTKQQSNRKIEELIDLDVMTDETTQAAMQILAILFSPIFMGVPNVLPLVSSKMISLSLQFGNSPISAVGYVIHGMVLCAFLEDVKTGYAFGKLALNLVNKFDARELRCTILTLFGCFIQHRQEALNSIMLTLKAAYITGIETGDFLYPGYSISAYGYACFFSGLELSSTDTDLAKYSDALGQLKQYSAQLFVDMTRQTVHNLMETVDKVDCLIGTAYDETIMIGNYFQR